MKLLVVHLSDVHFSGSSNAITDRSTAIASAAMSSFPTAEHVLLVFSGDIVNKGESEGYLIAREFIQDTVTRINSRKQPPQSIKLAIVPGNHDCNLSTDQAARTKILSNLIECDLTQPSILSTLLTPQNSFYDFVSRLKAEVITGTTDNPNVYQRLVYDEHIVDLLLLNSAICTQVNEKPGTLHLAPIPDSNQSSDDTKATITLAICHHPPHWLTPSSLHRFRDRILSDNALVLTGHEHRRDLITQSKNKSIAHSLEGGVLQDAADPHTSVFYTIAIDTDSAHIVLHEHQWKDTLYSKINEQALAWPTPPLDSKKSGLPLQANTLSMLRDPGDLVAHPVKASVSLQDIFVWPDLQRKKSLLKSDRSTTLVSGESLLDSLLTNDVNLIQGNARAGKTSLSKEIFRAYWNSGHLPLLLKGSQLRISSDHAIADSINKAIDSTYVTQTPEAYLHSERTKILIIDDFGDCFASHSKLELLIKSLLSRFDHIVLLKSQSLEIEDITSDEGELLDTLSDVVQFNLLSLGYAARSQLVSKWVKLGKSPANDPSEVDAEIIDTENMIEDLLGKDIVPPLPFYVLSLLAALGQQNRPQANLGSLGYLYDLLIRTSLANSVNDLEYMQAYDRFLGDLAYGMYQNQESALTREVFDERCEQFADRFDLDFNSNRSLATLVDAHVLYEKAGYVYFKYPYIFYYFVASHLSQRLSTVEGKTTVTSLVNRLHHADSSNILQFLCHCTSDPLVIDEILYKIRSVFENEPQIDFDLHAKQLSNIAKQHTANDLALGPGRPAANRSSLLQRRDEAERHKDGESVSIEENPVASPCYDSMDEAQEPSLSHEISSAFRVIAIVGQILRNHPGAIEGSKKLSLVAECASLSRRMMHSLLGEYSANSDRIINALQAAIAKRKSNMPAHKVRLLSEKLVQVEFETIALGIIGAYASSVHLRTLQPVLKRHTSTSKGDGTLELLSLAIELENPRHFPGAKAIELEKKYHNNTFVSECLKFMVFMYLYLYEVEDRTQKHSACEHFGIRIKDTLRLVSNK